MDKNSKSIMETFKTYVGNVAASLSDSPITKGLIPTVAGTGISMMEGLEIALRLTSVSLAIVIGALTVYVKWGDAVKVYKKRNEKIK